MSRTIAVTGFVRRIVVLAGLLAGGGASARAEPAVEALPPVAALQPDASAAVLEQLEATALANSPAVAQAAARVRAAEGRWLQNGLPPNPVAGYRAEEVGDDGTAGKQGGFVRQQIVTGGKLGLARNAACHEVNQARFALAVAQRRVMTDVRLAYVEVLAAERSVEMATELVRIGQEGLKAAEDLFRAREVSRLDELQARIESETAALRLADGQRRRETALRRLSAVVGAAVTMPPGARPDDFLPSWTWEESLQRLLAHSPRLAAAEAAAAAARAAVALEEARRLPNVEVEAGVQHDNAAGQTLAGFELSMGLPLFDRNQGNRCRAAAEWAAACAEVRRLRQELEVELSAVFGRYDTARAEVDRYRQGILPAASASLELVQHGYRQGELAYLAVLTAQRTYIQSQLAYLESWRTMHLAAAQIEGLLLHSAASANSD